jgi:hypothetical protein
MMSSPTISPQATAAGSTSTTATESSPPAAKPQPAARLTLKQTVPVLTAVRTTVDRLVELASGAQVQARAGDYLVSKIGGKAILDVVPPGDIDAKYDRLVDGALTLPPAICKQIEQTTGFASTTSAGDLVRAIERLARIGIGDVHVEFTPGQLEELKHRALKRGRTVEAEVKAVVDRIRDELFWKGA